MIKTKSERRNKMKEYRTAEQIAALTDNKDGIANIRAINALYRAQDESHLYPIRNRFNATERAIRRVRRFAKDYGTLYGLEYSYVIDNESTEIVNDSNQF